MRITWIYIAILFVFSAITVHAENQTETSTKKESSEVTTQTATTSDGRKVILKSDGTWEYFKEPPPPIPVAVEPVPGPSLQSEPKAPVEPPPGTPVEPAPSAPVNPPPSTPVEPLPTAPVAKPGEKGSLSFDAGVQLKSGNVKPIANGTFYLLDADLQNILQNSGLKPEKRLSLLNTFSMANYGSSQGVERSMKTFATAMESIKTHVVATTTSDSNGKGQFSSIPAGTYYLMNAGVVYMDTGSLTDRNPVLWNVKIEIKPGQNSISLDQKNAVP